MNDNLYTQPWLNSHIGETSTYIEEIMANPEKAIVAVNKVESDMARLSVNRKIAKDSDDDCYMVRFHLPCQNAITLDEVVGDFYRLAKSKNIILRGPLRLPPENPKFITKKLSSGEEVKVLEVTDLPETVIALFCPEETVHQMISETIKPGVELGHIRVFNGPQVRKKLDQILRMIAFRNGSKRS